MKISLSSAFGACPEPGFWARCSTPSPESLAQNDPWEKTNRDIFDFDVRLDHAVARPSPRAIATWCPSRCATASTMP